eukprot:83269-Amphidinium_carterae.1
MLPEYGQQQPSPPPAEGTAAAGTAAAGATAGQQQTTEKKQRPYIKWCLINVVINEELLNSMSSEDAAAQHLDTYVWVPAIKVQQTLYRLQH